VSDVTRPQHRAGWAVSPCMRSVVLALVLLLWAGAPAGATYPGRDGRIAFFAGAGCGRNSFPEDPCNALRFNAVLAISAFDRDIVQLARCPGPPCAGVAYRQPTYSPDGRLMAVIASSTSPAQVAILRADGSEAQRIGVPASVLSGVDWLPDGRLVAYAAPEGDGASGGVLVVGADGVAHEATWRPKGARAWSARGSVAISHVRGIYVRKRASDVARLVLSNGSRFTYALPDWSPDGRRLVVVRSDTTSSLQTIVTVSADGDDRRVVVRSTGSGCSFGDVVWSPSGKRIAYTTGCYDSGAIYMVRTDGAHRRELFDSVSLTSGGQLEASIAPSISWQPSR
jgi:Tol biopolymer transport system component